MKDLTIGLEMKRAELGGSEREEARQRFAAKIRAAIRRVDAVEAMVRARLAGIAPAEAVRIAGREAAES